MSTSIHSQIKFRSTPLILRLIDLGLCVGLLLFLLPAFALISIIVRIGDSGPIFFQQARLGRGGQIFACYKFRTMKVETGDLLASYLQENPKEAKNWEVYRKLSHDPRVTPYGKFLRLTSLDELPQLFNVITGSMSLVGPRPITMDEVFMANPYVFILAYPLELPDFGK